ncbi:MAG TPA: hypothetical protein VMD29_14210 [Terracidiphilus sp.]|nr:hypothetical protein [Terracidiphilus sp.]
MSSQFPQILVPHHKHCCVPSNAIVDPTPRSRGKIGGLTPSHLQCARKYEDFAKEFAVGIAVPHRLQMGVIEAMYRLFHPYQPLLWADARFGNSPKQEQPRAPSVFKCIVRSILNPEMSGYVR